LKKLCIGNYCLFSVKYIGLIRMLEIDDVIIDWDDRMKTYQVYFNDAPVDDTIKITVVSTDSKKGNSIEDDDDEDDDNNGFYDEMDYIVGLPSGEVIFLRRDEIVKLKQVRLVRHEQYITYKHAVIKNEDVFRDEDLPDIEYVIFGKSKTKRKNIDLEEHEVDDDYHVKTAFSKSSSYMPDRSKKPEIEETKGFNFKVGDKIIAHSDLYGPVEVEVLDDPIHNPNGGDFDFSMIVSLNGDRRVSWHIRNTSNLLNNDKWNIFK